jgi:putative lipase involved disintegration of autophagic bodies
MIIIRAAVHKGWQIKQVEGDEDGLRGKVFAYDGGKVARPDCGDKDPSS